MKRILFMTAVLLFCVHGLAHAQLGRGEISVGYGMKPVTDWMDTYNDMLLDAVGMQNAVMDSWGGISVNYSFRLIGGFGIGATFVYSSNDQRLNGQSVSTRYYSIMPHLKMRWLNLRILSLYSRVNAGLTFAESKGAGQSCSAEKFAWQISPIGVELGGRLAAYAEAGVGTVGSLIVGLRFRF